MSGYYIRLSGSAPCKEYVDIENGRGESVDLVSDAIADGEDTLLELDATPNGRLYELVYEWQNAPGETTPDGQAAIFQILAEELESVIADD